jgi:nucleoside-diphosphate-sugar epimerase
LSVYKKAVVTGAEGFIGRAVADRLRADGVSVAGIDVHSTHPDVMAGDISRDGPWLETLDGADLVVHAAAYVHMAGDRDIFHGVNVAATRRVLDAARRAGVKRFVHLSSTAVYSERFPPNVDETHPPRISGNLYVDTKIASEQVVFQAHAAGEIPVTVIRPGDVYGPGSRPWTVVPVEMMKRRQFMLPGNGKGIFSPIYIDDLVSGLLLAAEHPDATGQAFNISCAQGVSNKEFFGHYARMLGVPLTCVPTMFVLPMAHAGYRLSRFLPISPDMNVPTVRFLLRENSHSIEKARSVLGWEPQVSLEDGMRSTERWLRESGLLAKGRDGDGDG